MMQREYNSYRKIYLPLVALIVFLAIFRFTTVASFAAGSGTDTDPYTTAAQTIQAMRNHLKAGKGEDIVVYYSQEVYDEVTSNNPSVASVSNFLCNSVFKHTGVCDEGDYLKQNIFTYSQYTGNPYKYVDGVKVYYAGFLNIQYCSTGGVKKESAETQVTDTNAALDAAMASLNLTSTMSEYEKVRAIYDYVRLNVTYDHDALDSNKSQAETLPAHSTYNAAVVGQAVCQGYSSMLYNMMLRADIDCRVITGTANGGAHAWNIVRIGDKYYNVDVTFDSDNGTDGYFLKAQNTTDFPDHERNSDYKGDFYTLYPMAESNYARPNAGVKLNGCSVGVGGSILVNYNFYLPESMRNDNTNVVFTFPNDAGDLYKQEVNFNQARKMGKVEYVGEGKGNVKLIDGDYYYCEQGEGDYSFVVSSYRFTCAVPASRLSDSITAAVVSSGASGEVYPISVKKFADVIIENPSGRGATESQVNFLKALLNYGSYSQLYFNYNTGKLANAAWGDTTPASIDTSAYGFDKPTNDIGITYYGSSLLFKSDTIERHYFNLGEYTDLTSIKNDFTFMIDGQSVDPVIKEHWVYIQKEGISAKDLDEAYTVTVTKKSDNTSITFNYSALNYVKQIIDKSSTNATTKGLMRAIFDYSSKAKAL